MRFPVPSTLKQDFNDFLQTSVCYDIKYCRDILADEPVWVDERAEITAINYKSKQYGSDASLRMTLSLDSQIQKGDILIHDGKQFVVSWQVNTDQPNARATIIDMLPVVAEFKRLMPDEIDQDTGRILSKGGYQTVVPPIRASVTVFGSYEARLSSGEPGIFPSNRLTLTTQANPTTLGIKIGDVFEWRGNVHEVKNILYNELNYDGETGLIILHLEKEAIDS